MAKLKDSVMFLDVSPTNGVLPHCRHLNTSAFLRLLLVTFQKAGLVELDVFAAKPKPSTR